MYETNKDIRVGYGIEDRTLAAVVFQALNERAGGIRIYASDLYHDARELYVWLEERRQHRDPEGCTFFWQVRDSGTSMGRTDEYMGRGPAPYRVRVWMDGESSMLRIEGGPVAALQTGEDSNAGR